MEDWGVIILVIGVSISLILMSIFPLEFADVARRKGYDSSKYFWLTLLFGWVGYILVLALPDKNASEQREEILKILLKCSKDE